MLLGTWEQTIDQQGGLVLPPLFRPLVGEAFIATRGFDACIQVFPMPTWGGLVERVEHLSLVADASRALRRFLFGAAIQLEVRDTGLIVLPAALRQFAGLQERCFCVGMNTYFEIWSPERWIPVASQVPAAF